MENVYHKKTWNVGVTQVHMKTPPTPLIKNKQYDNTDKYFVKLKLNRDPTSKKSDLYEFMMALFYNGDTEEFFVCSKH